MQRKKAQKGNRTRDEKIFVLLWRQGARDGERCASRNRAWLPERPRRGHQMCPGRRVGRIQRRSWRGGRQWRASSSPILLEKYGCGGLGGGRPGEKRSRYVRTYTCVFPSSASAHNQIASRLRPRVLVLASCPGTVAIGSTRQRVVRERLRPQSLHSIQSTQIYPLR